jgi:hypothetical protein
LEDALSLNLENSQLLLKFLEKLNQEKQEFLSLQEKKK